MSYFLFRDTMMEASNSAIVRLCHVTPITPNTREEMPSRMAATVIHSVRLSVIVALTLIFGKGMKHLTNNKRTYFPLILD